MPQLGEFDIIERFFVRRGDDASVRVGIGDDAAVVTAGPAVAVAVDMLVAGRHFPDSMPADAIGHRALAVNLSDLAACGARPRWATLALSLPEADEDWLASFAKGFFRLAEQNGVALIGGDTTRGPLTVTVQLIGDAPERPLLRSGGRAGDAVFVSGNLGDAAAALAQIGGSTAASGGRPQRYRNTPAEADGGSNGSADEGSADNALVDALIAHFYYPEPRVALGVALNGLATAAIDVSDGLLADLGHLCRQSSCGAEIDLAALPLSGSLRALYAEDDARAFALEGGDDYELCFTVPADQREAVVAAAADAQTPISEIGRLTEGGALTGRDRGQSVPLETRGFTHF
ncbi:MAG: thiamine-phosphate kinase [Gammaproteobacteria bacterium]|nr:thiamine-phosphate kinase [Gammaproteobacteria bacterium]